MQEDQTCLLPLMKPQPMSVARAEADFACSNGNLGSNIHANRASRKGYKQLLTVS